MSMKVALVHEWLERYAGSVKGTEMTKPSPITTGNVLTSQLRNKMICDTEQFQNQTQLPSREVVSNSPDNFLGKPAQSATTATPCNDRQHNKPCELHASRPGTFVEVSGNEHGHLDEMLVCNLRFRLQRLLLKAREGDILLDVTQLRSVTSGFSQLVHEMSHNLASQGRRILLFNERIGLSDDVSEGGA